jgi:hypothetical protein
MGIGRRTVKRSESVPDIRTAKSSCRVLPQYFFTFLASEKIREENIPWSPQMARKAVKKLTVHKVMMTIHAMMKGR